MNQRLWVLLAGLLASGCSQPEPAPSAPARLFSFALIADPHIVSPTGERNDRLQAAVAWINEHAAERSIEVVAVLGDVGWGEGLPFAKVLLDELSVPYVPIIGDNVIVNGDEALFEQVFRPQYDKLAGELDGWRVAPTPVFSESQGIDLLLQNAAFVHRGVHFFVADWNARAMSSTISEFGDLHDIAGGSWPWLQDQFSRTTTEQSESVVFLSHIPMMLGAFDTEEMPAINAVLGARSSEVYANFAGHVHANFEWQEEGFEIFMTDATFDDENTVRVVEVKQLEGDLQYEHELVVVGP